MSTPPMTTNSGQEHAGEGVARYTIGQRGMRKCDDGEFVSYTDHCAALEKLTRERDVASENERLRFEGDLDKWMKTLGAGITGYQPEAYAVMDAACLELVSARARIAALEAENARMREALQPFARAYENCRPDPQDVRNGFARDLDSLLDDEHALTTPRLGDLRRARAILGEHP